MGSNWTAPTSRPIPLATTTRGDEFRRQPMQTRQVGIVSQPSRGKYLRVSDQQERETRLGQEREPDVLRAAQQNLRSGQEGQEGLGQGHFPALGIDHHDVDHRQQPRDVGHGRHRVGMDEVQEVETRKRKGQTAHHGRILPPQPAAEQEVHPPQHQRIAAQIFPAECGMKGQKAIEEAVQRMVRADLALAREVKTRVDVGHPVERFAVGQLFGIEGPRRQVEIAQVVGRIETAAKKGMASSDSRITAASSAQANKSRSLCAVTRGMRLPRRNDMGCTIEVPTACNRRRVFNKQ